MTLRSALAALMAALALAGCSSLGIDYKAPTDASLRSDLAVVAARQGDYALAYQLDAPLARNGNYESQWRLSVLYAKGLHVAKDLNEAGYWSALATKGNTEIFVRTWEGIKAQLSKEEVDALIARAKEFKPEPLPKDYRDWRGKLEAARSS